MRKADFTARVQKILITNRVRAEDWDQSITLVLSDIELTDENLLELRQFKPNEAVMVVITPAQATIFDYLKKGKGKPPRGGQGGEEELIAIEEDGDGPPEGRVVREWKF